MAKRPVYQEFDSPDAGRAALLKTVSEADLQACVTDAARLRGLLCFHDADVRRCVQCGHAQPDTRPRGFPDLILLIPPTLYAWEMKTMKGKPSPEQERWLAELAACTRVESGLMRPADLETMLEVLSRE